jgi:hypothetical protein
MIVDITPPPINRRTTLKTTHTLSIPSRQLVNCEQTYEPATITGLVDSLHYQVRCWEHANQTKADGHPIFQTIRSAVSRSKKEYRPTSSGTIYPAYVIDDACAILGMLTQAGEIMGGYVTHEQMMIRSGIAASNTTPVGQQVFLDYLNRKRNVGEILRLMMADEHALPTVPKRERIQHLAEMSNTGLIGYSDLHLRAYVSMFDDTMDSGVEFTSDDLKCALTELLSDKFDSSEIPGTILRPHGQMTAAEMMRRMQNSIIKTAITSGPLRSLCDELCAVVGGGDRFITSIQNSGTAVSIAGKIRRPAYWLKLYTNSFSVCKGYESDDKPSVEDLYACVGLAILRAYDQMVLGGR